MTKILHVVTTLSGGGAEAALTRLVLADRANVHVVVGLAGGYAPQLVERGIRVESLGMARSAFPAAAVISLTRLIREVRPDVIQTWMYHGDLIGGIAAKLAGGIPVVWGIRNANLDRSAIGLRTALIARACAMMSTRFPAQIVSCSVAGRDVHVTSGYDESRLRVIPNGFDLSELKRDSAGRQRVRAEWNIPESTLLFGMVARWDPQKDHETLIAALAQLSSRVEWRCALIGRGMDAGNKRLSKLVAEHDLRDRILLCGARPDLRDVMSALDFHVLSSLSEAFPNVVAEAMACETPCVVTDAGDAGMIVGDTGWIVPPRDPVALASAMGEAMEAFADRDRWRRRQESARARIAAEFGVQRMVSGYAKAWAAAVEWADAHSACHSTARGIPSSSGTRGT